MTFMKVCVLINTSNQIFLPVFFNCKGQGRLDGVFCDYTAEDKMTYLKKCQENNVCNIEMESLCFASFFNHANMKGIHLKNQ